MPSFQNANVLFLNLSASLLAEDGSALRQRSAAARGPIVAMTPSSAVAAFFAAVLVVMVASAMRQTVPGVREATRGTSTQAKAQARVDEARRRSNEREGIAQDPGVRSLKTTIFAALRAALPRPDGALFMPAQLAPGAYALGTSLPRRLRWKALGGHGRNGPGSRT